MDANAKIVLAVDAYLIQNRPILNITGTGAEVENAMIAGKNSTSDFYKSGIPNYNIFNWKKKDFYDPIFQQSYLLWVTSLDGWRYQTAFLIEDDSGFSSRVLGKWMPRNTQIIAGDATIWSRDFSIANVKDIRYFFEGDEVSATGLTPGTIIENISSDGMTLQMSSPFTLTSTGVQLAAAEPLGLVGSKNDKTIPVTDYTKNLPY